MTTGRLPAAEGGAVLMDGDFITLAEFARRTGVCARTVRNWVAKGSIPVFQPGGPGSKVLIPVSSLKTESVTVDAGRPSRSTYEGGFVCSSCRSTAEGAKTATENGSSMLSEKAPTLRDVLSEIKACSTATKTRKTTRSKSEEPNDKGS